MYRIHLVKGMGTWSWLNLVCHKIGCITFPTEKLPDFCNNQSLPYRGHLALVQHNTNFTTVHSPVTVGGCSVKYKYKLLCQFACFVVHRMLYTSVFSICTTLVQGHTKRVWNRNFPVCHSSRRLYPFREYPVAFHPLPLCSIPRYEQKRFVWPCSELVWLSLNHK